MSAPRIRARVGPPLVHVGGHARDRDGADPVTDPVALAAAPFLTRGVDLNELLVAVVDTIVERLEADRGTLYLVDGAAGRLSSVVAHLPELERIELELGQGIAGSVAQQGQAIEVPDASVDARFDPTVDARTGYRTRSMLALPIRDQGDQVIGVLQLLNLPAEKFAPDARALAETLAAQAGRVLEATSLYADLRRRGAVEGPRPGLHVRFNQIVGESAAMRDVYGLVRKAARTDATVLITGESGTGKELVARAVHVNGGRREGPLVKVDCTTLPEALVENELFGHERGAFTGADRAVPGKFEIAEGGTLFLDEIGELPAKVQGKLLRAIQDREFERVGGTRTRRADVRIVAATHRDLARMVDEGTFREDLYYRIRVVPIRLPPLRERGPEDLARLVEHFVERFARRHRRPIERVTPRAIARLTEHDWPGNVRELENCIESAVVLADAPIIDVDDLALAPRRRTASPTGPRIGDPSVTLDAIELAHVQGVVDACGGNRSEAARRLGISRNRLARRLEGESE